jgi:hypothetical protein
MLLLSLAEAIVCLSESEDKSTCTQRLPITVIPVITFMLSIPIPIHVGRLHKPIITIIQMIFAI